MRRGWIDIQRPTTTQLSSIIFPFICSSRLSQNVYTKRLQIAKVNRLTAHKRTHYILCRNNQSGWHFCHAVCIFIFAANKNPAWENRPRETKRLTLQKSSVTRFVYATNWLNRTTYIDDRLVDVALVCVCQLMVKVCGSPWKIVVVYAWSIWSMRSHWDTRLKM